jgi:acyl carrier protein
MGRLVSPGNAVRTPDSTTRTVDAVSDLVRDCLHPRPETPVVDDADLVALGLDSLVLIQIVAGLQDLYGIEIALADLDPRNFQTAGAIKRFVEHKLAAEPR